MPHLTLNVYEVGPLLGATSIFHTLYLPWVSPPLVFTVYTSPNIQRLFIGLITEIKTLQTQTLTSPKFE